MVVDLIRVPDPTCIDDLLDEPLGLLYLAAVIRDAGYAVRITNLAGHSETSWQSEIKDADIYSIQLYTPTAPLGIQIAHFIKETFPGRPVIGGGAHPSAVPESKELTIFDHIVIGEGERSFVKVVDAFKNNKSLRGL